MVSRRRVLGALGVGTVGLVIGGEADAIKILDDQRRASLRSVSAVVTRGEARGWWSGPTQDRVVALTFDDGPTEQFTARVLEILAARDVRATFFAIGALAELRPHLLTQVAQAGHEVGNHSYDHLKAAVLTPEKVARGVIRGRDAVASVTGIRPRWYRPPRGEITSGVLAAARAAQADLALWSGERGPAADTDSAGVGAHLATAVHPGAIALLHDGIGRSSWVGRPDGTLLARRSAEIAALPEVLRRWQEAGYRFVTLSELVPAAPAPAG